MMMLTLTLHRRINVVCPQIDGIGPGHPILTNVVTNDLSASSVLMSEAETCGRPGSAAPAWSREKQLLQIQMSIL